MFPAGASTLGFLVAITLAGCGQTPTSQAHGRVQRILEKHRYPEAVRIVAEGLEKNPMNRNLLEDRLILLLANGNRGSRQDLLETQKQLDTLHDGRQLLMDQARNPQGNIRRQVAWMLGALNEERGMETLCFLAEDREPEVRAEAIHSLARLKDPASRNLLLIRLRDVNWMVRAESAEALGETGDASVTTQLFRSANDKDAYVRSRVFEAIVAVAAVSQREIYQENCRSKEIGRRTAAALALQKCRQPEARMLLLDLLKDPKTPDRKMVAEALAQSGDASLRGEFEALLPREKEAAVKESMLAYFEIWADPEAQRVLQKYR